MSDAADLNNRLAPQILRAIVTPVIERGGGMSEILVVAESVMLGVVEFCAKHDALSRDVVLDTLVAGVQRRLDGFASSPTGEQG